MDRQSAILITLVVYKLVLIGIGLWANRRTKNTADFFLGGRHLGPWVAAVSACASSSSAWTLLGVSGAAYSMGFSVVWLFPAGVGGFWFNWYWIAPRIRRQAETHDAITLTDLLAGRGHAWVKPIAILASFAITFSFAFYVAAQFQASGDTFMATFGVNLATSIIIGAAIILVYTLLGGFWAVSMTDTLQGLLMALTALVLPTAALIAVGGPFALVSGLAQIDGGRLLGLSGSHAGWLGVAFIAGMLGVGLGNPGQPHVVNRLMALRDEKAQRRGRLIAVTWATVVFGGMMVLGWCGRLLVQDIDNHERIFFVLTQQLFGPIVAGVIVAAVLSAIMSTADSQLLVAASAVSHDLRRDREHAKSIWVSRLAVVAMCLVSALLALFAPEAIFTRVLFAWSAIGAAFGPLLIIRLMDRHIQPRWVFTAMACGFFLTVFFNWQADPPPGRYLERIVPFAVAFAAAWFGSRSERPRTTVS